MPIKVIRPDHFELLGEGHVLLVSLHQPDSENESQAGRIVEDAALACRAYAIMGKANEIYSDPSRTQAARKELRNSVETMLSNNEIYCVIEIHIEKDTGVEIWTGNGETASPRVVELVKSRLSRDYSPGADQPLGSGNNLVKDIAKKGPDGRFLVQALRLELRRAKTTDERDKLVTTIAELTVLVNQNLSFKEDSPLVGIHQ